MKTIKIILALLTMSIFLMACGNTNTPEKKSR